MKEVGEDFAIETFANRSLASGKSQQLVSLAAPEFMEKRGLRPRTTVIYSDDFLYEADGANSVEGGMIEAED